MKHENGTFCLKCNEIIERYPSINQEVERFFWDLKSRFPELHAAEFGRDKINQELMFERGASRAHFGQSAHNYNAAVDVFFQVYGNYNTDIKRFLDLEPFIPETIEWYGREGSKFYERPHFELKNWREMVEQGLLKPIV